MSATKTSANYAEFGRDSSVDKDLLVRQLLTLFDKYRHCLSAFVDDCKCDHNLETRLLFDDLENQFKAYFNSHRNYFAAIQQFRHNYNQISKQLSTFAERKKLDQNCGRNQIICVDLGSKGVTSKRDKAQSKSGFEVELIGVNDGFDARNNDLVFNHLNAINDSERNGSDYVSDVVKVEKPDSDCGDDNSDDQLSTHSAKSDKNGPKFQYMSTIMDKLKLSSADSLVADAHRIRLPSELVISSHWIGHQSSDTTRPAVRRSRHHSNSKPFACQVSGCEQRFASNRNLMVHRSRRHSDDRPYPCSQCSDSFKMRSLLERHVIMKHTDIKPFACAQCHKEFALKDHLRSHIIKVHSVKQFACDDCDYMAKTRTHLNIHRRCVHLRERLFSCDAPDCQGKSFFSKGGLDNHRMSVHSDRRQFVCDWPECGATFKVKNHLTAHYKTIHTGDYAPKRKRFSK